MANISLTPVSVNITCSVSKLVDAPTNLGFGSDTVGGTVYTAPFPRNKTVYWPDNSNNVNFECIQIPLGWTQPTTVVTAPGSVNTNQIYSGPINTTGGCYEEIWFKVNSLQKPLANQWSIVKGADFCIDDPGQSASMLRPAGNNYDIAVTEDTNLDFSRSNVIAWNINYSAVAGTEPYGTYSFKVRYFQYIGGTADSNKVYSDYSNQFDAAIDPYQLYSGVLTLTPAVITNLVAAQYSTSVVLNWTNTMVYTSSVTINVSTDGTNYSPAATGLALNLTTYTYTVTPGNHYWFTVTTVNYQTSTTSTPVDIVTVATPNVKVSNAPFPITLRVPSPTLTINSQATLVTTGLKYYIHAGFATGLYPGTNSNPQITTWKDLTAGLAAVTLTNFGYTTSTGWAGSGTDADPYCLVFDGTNDYCTGTTNANVAIGTNLSVDGWIYISGVSIGPTLISQCTDSTHNWFIYVETNGTLRFVSNNGGTHVNQYTSNAVTTGVWHYFAVTKSGSTVIIYIDGSVVTSTANTTYTETLTAGFEIGGTIGSTPYPWQGKINSLRIYNTTLTPANITSNYNLGMVVNGAFVVMPTLTLGATAVSPVVTTPNAVISLPALTISANKYTPSVSLVPVGAPNYVIPGLQLHLHAAMAANGTGPGINSPSTTNWYDLQQLYTSLPLSNFAYTTTEGWAGSNSVADPYRLTTAATDYTYIQNTNTNSALTPQLNCTIEVWFNCLGTAVGHATQYQSVVSYVIDTNNYWNVIVDTTTPYLYLSCAVAGGSYGVRVTSASYTNNNWYQAVLTVDGSGTRTVYINGTSTTNFQNSNNAPQAVTGLVLLGIGATSGTPAITRYFNGSVAIVRYYNRALSAGEVSQNYTAGITWGASTSASVSLTTLGITANKYSPVSEGTITSVTVSLPTQTITVAEPALSSIQTTGGVTLPIPGPQTTAIQTYSPTPTIFINTPPNIVIDGLTFFLHAAMANNGSSPGSNSPATSNWYDIQQNISPLTLNNYAYTSTEGWSGSNSVGSPSALTSATVDATYIQNTNINNALSIQLNSTVEIWFYAVGTIVNRAIQYQVPVSYIANASNYWNVEIDVTTPHLYISYVIGGTFYGLRTTANYANATWYQAVLTVDSSGSSVLYLNGAVAPSQSSVATPSATVAGLVIGGMATSSGSPAIGRYFNGSISIIRYYKKALTAAQVLQNYNAGIVWGTNTSVTSPVQAITSASYSTTFASGVLLNPTVQSIASASKNLSVTTTSSNSVSINLTTQAIGCSLLNPTLATGSSLTESVQALTSNKYSPSVVTSSTTTLSLSVQALTATTYDPSIRTQALVTMPVQTIGATLVSPTILTGTAISLTTLSLSVGKNGPSIATSDVIQLTVQAISISKYTPSITASGSSTLSLPYLTNSITLYTPNVTANSATSISLPVLAVSVGKNSPTIFSGITLHLSPIYLTVSKYTPAASIQESSQYIIDGGTASTHYPDIIDCGNSSLNPFTTTIMSYTIPDSHIIDVGYAQLCNVACSFQFTGDSDAQNIDQVQNIDTLMNFDGNWGPIISTSKIQINLADNSNKFYDANWQDLTQNQYYFRAIKFRAVLNTLDYNVLPILNSMKIMVDVPSLRQTNTIFNSATTGTSITYSTPFQLTPRNYFSVDQWSVVPQTVRFSADGSKLWILNSLTNTIVTASLSSPYQIYTDKFTDSYKSTVTSNSITALDIKEDDGTMFWVLDGTTGIIYEYQCNEAWTASSAIYTGRSVNILAQDSTPRGILISPNGNNLYVVGDATNTIYQYPIATPYRINTASYSGTKLVLGTNVNPLDIFMDSAGNNLYVLVSNTTSINQYSLSSPGVVSSGTLIQTFSVAAQDSTPLSIAFDSTGSNLYMAGRQTDTIYQYSVSNPGMVISSTYVNPPILNPNLQCTILNPQSGDILNITNNTNLGFTVQVLNNNAGVSRNISWSAIGF